ncbi:hypothetical protein [Roseivirga sp. UBA1976]|uniref:hypothetical protein n=1 Tax=Roseivirga sp. UBA1976 TaxID=1947386 RepID=UPI00257AB6D4|nr:hypothetical protein [Roseivirga sp. UBA1976]MEC7752703.1 hypothetical protein [Bacteroidota bacterium]|tara:strand:+ start:5037 stop:5252 length:216 start_codon:yes stop_codon:yes gene_type:complete
MKKAKRLVVALILILMSVLGLQAFNGDGNACGCIEDCTRFCDTDLLKSCEIVYTTGHTLTCPQKTPKPEPQ